MVKLNRRVRVIVSSAVQNDQGGNECIEVDSWEKWAQVENRTGGNSFPSQQQVWEYDAKITMRHETSRPMQSNYEIEYENARYKVESLSVDSEGFKMYDVCRCSKVDEVVTGEGSGGGGSVVNWEDFDYDDPTGTFTMVNGNPNGNRTLISLFAYPYTGFNYINGENSAVTAGPFNGDTLVIDRLTPGQLIVRWRIQNNQGIPLTAWAERVLTVVQLSQRWYQVFSDVSGNLIQTPIVFAPLQFYNFAGALNPAVIDDSAELVSEWNLDAGNVNFQISNTRGSIYLEVLLIPNPLSAIYPYQYVLTVPI